MIVEIFGPSCVGKTTLIENVSSELRGNGVAVTHHSGATDIRSNISVAALLRGLCSVRVVTWCLVNPRRAWSRTGRWFVHARGVRCRAGKGRGVAILDEGPLKVVARVAEDSRLPNLLVRSIPEPDLAVLVTCDFDVRLERMRSTGRAHAASQSDEFLAARDAAKAKWNQWACDTLQLDVVTLDTTAGEDWTSHLVTLIGDRLAQ